MSYWRKKPVVIEARQFTGDETEAKDLAEWCGGTYWTQEIGEPKGTQAIALQTLEGFHHAHVGDWIVRGVAGEFYNVRADIFAETYEPAEAES